MRYITKKESLAKFQGKVLQIVIAQLGKNHDTGAEDLDETLSSLITEELDIENEWMSSVRS
jgi:phosphopantetheinyl transferase